MSKIILVSADIARRNKDNLFKATNKFGDGTNYSQLSTNGTLTFLGTATTFDDLVFEMTASRLGALTKPDWDSTNLGFLFPPNDTGEYIDIIVQMPHKWAAGTTIYPHVHAIISGANQAVMKADYKWYNIGDTVPAGTSTYTMNTYSNEWSSGNLHTVIKGTGISGSGKTMSSLLQIRLYRDDNAYTGDLLVKQFDIHYEIDSIGSASEYTK